MAEDEKPSYLDENLSESEKKSGHTRLPMPEEEGEGRGKEQSGIQQPDSNERLNPDREDEFGDGDRRS